MTSPSEPLKVCPCCATVGWDDCPCPAGEQRDALRTRLEEAERDAAVRARAEVEAVLEGVRAYVADEESGHQQMAVAAHESKDGPGYYRHNAIRQAMHDLRTRLDAHPSDALRALVERAVREGFEAGLLGVRTPEARVLVARVLGGGR